MYRQELGNLLEPPPRLSTQTGKPHTVAQIIAAVQTRIGKEFTPFLYEAPTAPGQPATLRLIALGGAAKGPRVLSVLVDPVSLDLVRWRYEAFPGFLRVVIRLHGNLLMGRAGRIYVGWLGLAMLVLGDQRLDPMVAQVEPLAGRLLRQARRAGAALYRDLHGAIGIWTFVVFIPVSFSGVYFVFPQTVSAAITTLLPSRETNSPVADFERRGVQCIDADRAIAIALSTTPGARLVSIGLPLRPEQPYRVSFAHPGARRGVPEAAALINPWSGELVELIDPRRFRPSPDRSRLAGPALHFGQGLGWVWRILVCVSGLLPAIFAFTGVAMWLITRGARWRTVPPLARINLLGQADRRSPGHALASLFSPQRPGIHADRANFLWIVGICEIVGYGCRSSNRPQGLVLALSSLPRLPGSGHLRPAIVPFAAGIIRRLRHPHSLQRPARLRCARSLRR